MAKYCLKCFALLPSHSIANLRRFEEATGVSLFSATIPLHISPRESNEDWLDVLRSVGWTSVYITIPDAVYLGACATQLAAAA
jgi:hypothetical protein